MNTLHFKLALMGIISFSFSGGLHAAEKSSFEGCAGSQIMKSKGKLADIRKELSSVESRMQKICEEDLPDRLARINEYNNKCTAGADMRFEKIIDKASMDIYELAQNVDKACKSMRASVKDAKDYCTFRKNNLAKLESDIKNSDFLSPKGDPKTAPEGAQAAVFSKQFGVYNNGKITLKQLAVRADVASDAIYARLPDKDDNKSEVAARKRDEESADTKDPKLDEIVERSQSRLKKMAEGNKNKEACDSLASKKGDISKVATILKQNLWPNGKRAARAIKLMGNQDNLKGEEYGAMAAKSQDKAMSLGADDPAAKMAAEHKKQLESYGDPDKVARFKEKAAKKADSDVGIAAAVGSGSVEHLGVDRESAANRGVAAALGAQGEKSADPYKIAADNQAPSLQLNPAEANFVPENKPLREAETVLSQPPAMAGSECTYWGGFKGTYYIDENGKLKCSW